MRMKKNRLKVSILYLIYIDFFTTKFALNNEE